MFGTNLTPEYTSIEPLTVNSFAPPLNVKSLCITPDVPDVPVVNKVITPPT